MKIAFGNTDTGEKRAEWELTPSQQKFWDSKKKFVLFSGGYGCVAGETKVLNADTGKEIEIRNIKEPFRVFSHNGKKALALMPVKYEKAPLFKIKTDAYEFIGTEFHRVLTADGWKQIGELSVGERIVVSSADLPRSTSESFQSVLFSGVFRWMRKLQGFPYDYRPAPSFCGGLPHGAGDSVLEWFPLQFYVHGHTQEHLRKDDRSFLEEYSRACRESFLPSKNGSSPFGKRRLVSNGEGYTEESVFEHISAKVPLGRKVLWNFVSRRIKALKALCSLSCSYPYPTMTTEKIQALSYERTDHYYDLHVLGTHSYYAQGFFHHNCGKSLMLTLKAIDLSLRYPKNYILMGRKTYPELRDTLIKEFFSVCPVELIQDYWKAEGRVIFTNGSEIIFRHLDTIAESEIRSLNLGAAFIDQAEDVSREVFTGLRGRLRREGVADFDRHIYLSCNPALTWLFAEFKQFRKPEYEVIEASTLENAKNLPKEYVDDLLKYPEAYKRQYVYGVWDTSLLSENTVFDREYIERLMQTIKEPLRTFEGLNIFKEFVPGHRYQMGIDVAEGAETAVAEDKDRSVVVIADLDLEEEVASGAWRIPPDAMAEKAVKFARLYQDSKTKCLIIPEMNSVGMALVNKLKQFDGIRMYQREEYDRVSSKKVEKLGWRTTRSTKPLLVSRFQELLRLRNPVICEKETIEEFKSFVYSDVAKKQGMGAKEGFHDDRVIATLLAFWQKGPVVAGHVTRSEVKEEEGVRYFIKDGKIFPKRNLKPILFAEPSWLM